MRTLKFWFWRSKIIALLVTVGGGHGIIFLESVLGWILKNSRKLRAGSKRIVIHNTVWYVDEKFECSKCFFISIILIFWSDHRLPFSASVFFCWIFFVINTIVNFNFKPSFHFKYFWLVCTANFFSLAIPKNLPAGFGHQRTQSTDEFLNTIIVFHRTMFHWLRPQRESLHVSFYFFWFNMIFGQSKA